MKYKVGDRVRHINELFDGVTEVHSVSKTKTGEQIVMMQNSCMSLASRLELVERPNE